MLGEKDLLGIGESGNELLRDSMEVVDTSEPLREIRHTHAQYERESTHPYHDSPLGYQSPHPSRSLPLSCSLFSGPLIAFAFMRKLLEEHY